MTEWLLQEHPLSILNLNKLTIGTSFVWLWNGAKKNVYSTFHICWGAQAGLYYHYGIKKYPLKRKCLAYSLTSRLTLPIRLWEDLMMFTMFLIQGIQRRGFRTLRLLNSFRLFHTAKYRAFILYPIWIAGNFCNRSQRIWQRHTCQRIF